MIDRFRAFLAPFIEDAGDEIDEIEIEAATVRFDGWLAELSLGGYSQLVDPQNTAATEWLYKRKGADHYAELCQHELGDLHIIYAIDRGTYGEDVDTEDQVTGTFFFSRDIPNVHARLHIEQTYAQMIPGEVFFQIGLAMKRLERAAEYGKPEISLDNLKLISQLQRFAMHPPGTD